MTVPRVLIALLGPTASGKSSLALSLAERYGGEIVSCDSTAIYRRFDIGTDKVPVGQRRGIPHHLVDVADPAEAYTAARYAADASEAIRAIHQRNRVPILAGGTGFYFRALVRGLFPGPGRDAEMRARLEAIATRRGAPFLHRMVARVDSPSAARIQPRDLVRVIRALEVYFLTGRTLTAHFAATVSALPGVPVIGLLLHQPVEALAPRIAARVDSQFSRGLVEEARTLLADGVPPTARAFGSLGYKQVMEYLRGARDLGATKELTARETRHYARRQLIWFRKEPNLDRIPGPGELPATVDAATRIIDRRLRAAAC